MWIANNRMLRVKETLLLHTQHECVGRFNALILKNCFFCFVETNVTFQLLIYCNLLCPPTALLHTHHRGRRRDLTPTYRWYETCASGLSLLLCRKPNFCLEPSQIPLTRFIIVFLPLLHQNVEQKPQKTDTVMTVHM